MSHPDRDRLLDLALATGDEAADHVRGCAECRKALEELLREQKVLGEHYAAPLAAPVGEIERKVMRALEPPVRRLRKRDLDPLLAIVGVAALVFMGVVGFILFSPSGDTREQFAEEVKKLETEAGVADNAGRLDEAIAKYKLILAKMDGNPKFKSQAVTVKGIIKEIEQRKMLVAEADRRFLDLKARYQTVTDEGVGALHRDVQALLKDAEESTLPWLAELKEISERLEKIADTNVSIAKRMDFQVIRNEINEKHKLAAPAAEFSKAIVEWQTYIADKKVSGENRQKAQNEISNINLKAKSEVDRLKKRTPRTGEALDELKRHRPRFAGTAAEQDLESLIREVEK
ncbi:MAG TPA: hypothetical protein VJB14_08115 [Planctomycetota bacterium]|nr:hypothetical protein [Planctomycetota bacterium]